MRAEFCNADWSWGWNCGVRGTCGGANEPVGETGSAAFLDIGWWSGDRLLAIVSLEDAGAMSKPHFRQKRA